MLALWPWAERRADAATTRSTTCSSGRATHPRRTAFGAAFLAWVFLVFIAGSADRVTVWLGISYTAQIWVYRVAVWVVPVAVYFMVRRVCSELVTWERVRPRPR